MMKRFILGGLLALLFSTGAFAQCAGVNGGRICATPTGGGLAALTNAPVIGIPTSLLGTLGFAGNTSGTVTIKPQAAAGTYNFNLPTTAGSSGQAMLSGGGGAAAMTFGTLGVPGGGTGAITLTGILQGNGAAAVTTITDSSTTGQVLRVTGASTYAWGAVDLSNANAVVNALPVNRGGTNCSAASGTCVDNVSGFASTGIMSRTGAGTYTFSTLSALLDAIGSTRGSVIYRGAAGWAALTPGAATTVLTSNGAGADPSYAAAGSGTVTSLTPGAGQVSSVTASCSQTAITTTGTISSAECLNAQTGASYAILDGDRAKLVTASNAGAQAYTIAQAGAASAFQNGWFVDLRNISTNVAGIVTITPTTSTINGAATLKVHPGQSVRIASDGTNYQTTFAGSAAQVPGTATNDAANAGNLGEYQSNTLAVGSAVSVTNGSVNNITSITNLPAGDWDITGTACFVPAATTQTALYKASISQTSATLDTTTGNYVQIAYVTAALINEDCLPVPMVRYSLSSATTIYIVQTSNFAVSTMTGYGSIRARRVR